MRKLCLLLMLVSFTGCSLLQTIINPSYEPPSELALKGEANDHALNEQGSKIDNARVALEQMSTYKSALAPQPNNPVMQPSVIRVMWIPDHLNKSGDLVPAHYYYLKVLKERWAVTDAFELESQLKTGNDASNVPYIYKGKR